MLREKRFLLLFYCCFMLIFAICHGLELTKLQQQQQQHNGNNGSLDIEKSISSSSEENETESTPSVHMTRSLKENNENSKTNNNNNNEYNIAESEIKILNALEEAMNAVSDIRCHNDLNQTLQGVRMRKKWAIASKLYFFLLNFHLLSLVDFTSRKCTLLMKSKFYAN